MSGEPRFRVPMPPGGKWTDADIDALRADVPYRTEIVDGNLIVSPAPHPWHSNVVREVTNVLVAAARSGGWAYGETDLRWDSEDGERRSVIPDVLVAPRALLEADRPYPKPEIVQLAVEVVSPSTQWRDRHERPGLYAALGIPAMWRIERGITLVEYRLTREGGPEVVQAVTGGLFTTEVPFPVTVDLDALR